jgi:hypothetical protein
LIADQSIQVLKTNRPVSFCKKSSSEKNQTKNPVSVNFFFFLLENQSLKRPVDPELENHPIPEKLRRP